MNVITTKSGGPAHTSPDGAERGHGTRGLSRGYTMPGMIGAGSAQPASAREHPRGNHISKAEAGDGSRRWFTARDIVIFGDKSVPGSGSKTCDGVPQCDAREKALFPGHPVAAVAATHEAIAA